MEMQNISKMENKTDIGLTADQTLQKKRPMSLKYSNS